MKRVIRFILFALLIFGFANSSSAEDGGLKYLKGIKEHEFKQKPYIVDAVIDDKLYMLPLRETMESLGYTVKWYRDGTIKVNKGFIRATLIVNNDYYLDRYDVQKKLYTTPVYNEGVCYVPNIFFSEILNYDIFTMDDSIYIRSKIDGILSKTSTSIKTYDNDGKAFKSKIDFVYPTFSKEYHLFINDIIKEYIEKIKEEYRFEKINIMYDIAIANSKIVSVIFRGDLITGDTKQDFFSSLNFDVKAKKMIKLSDIIVDTQGSNKFLKEGLKFDGDRLDLESLNMYIVKDAIVIYENLNRSMTLSKYYKLYELEHLASQRGQFLFER